MFHIYFFSTTCAVSLFISFCKKQKFDIVFLDPPYAGDMVQDAIDRMVRADILADGALICCESDRDIPFGGEGLTVKRFAKYSKTYLTILVNEGVSDNG